MSSEIVENFRQVTGADEETALSFLTACNNNLDMAVSLFMDDSTGAPQNPVDECRSPIPQRTEQLVPTEMPFYPTQIRTLTSRRRRRAFVADDSDPEDGTVDGGTVINCTRSTTLPAPSNGKSATTRNLSFPQTQPSGSTDLSTSVPSSSSVGTPLDTSSTSSDASASRLNCVNGTRKESISYKRGRLQQLFQPPTEILFQGSLAAAQTSAQEKNQWLLISLHDEGCFDCHLLNRDVWKEPRIYQLIKRNFTFLQIPVDSSDAIVYRARHSYVQSASHIAVHDPTTGEQKVVWIHMKDPDSVFELLSDFLRKTSNPIASTASSGSSTLGQRRHLDTQISSQHGLDRPLKRLRLDPSHPGVSVNAAHGHLDSSRIAAYRGDVKDPLDLSEEEQLQLAIRASQQDSTDAPSTSTICPTQKLSVPESQDSPIFLTDDGDESPHTDTSDNDADCFIVDSNVVRTSTTATISARRPLRPPPPPQHDHSKSSVPPDFSLPIPGPNEPAVELLFRFPSGARECLRLSPSLKLQTLQSYLDSRGFPHSQYELVHFYPHISLSNLPPTTTLDQIGLAKKDTVFVQER